MTDQTPTPAPEPDRITPLEARVAVLEAPAAVAGVTRLSAWPKSVLPKDQKPAKHTGNRHVGIAGAESEVPEAEAEPSGEEPGEE